MDPVTAPSGSRITLTGIGLAPNQAFQIALTGSSPFDQVNSDGSGNFTKEIALPNVDPGDYNICAQPPSAPAVCAYLHVVAPSSVAPEPSPTVPPTAAPSPSSSPSPVSAPIAPPPTSTNPLGYLIQPPFVFFPALLLLAAIAWLAYWLWSLRPPPALGDEVVFQHRAPLPRERSVDLELVHPVTPAAPAAPTPPVYESAPEAAPKEPAKPPQASDIPVEGDLPPDLPTASD